MAVPPVTRAYLSLWYARGGRRAGAARQHPRPALLLQGAGATRWRH